MRRKGSGPAKTNRGRTRAAFFAATAGLVLAQVLDPVTVQQIIAVITGMGA